MLTEWCVWNNGDKIITSNRPKDLSDQFDVPKKS